MSSTFRTTNPVEPVRPPTLPAPIPSSVAPEPAPRPPRHPDHNELFVGLIGGSSDDGLGALAQPLIRGRPDVSGSSSRAGSAGLGGGSGTKRKAGGGGGGGGGSNSGDGPVKKAKAYQHATAEVNGGSGSSSVLNWSDGSASLASLTATLGLPSTEGHGGLGQNRVQHESNSSFGLDLGQLPTLSSYSQSSFQGLDFDLFNQSSTSESQPPVISHQPPPGHAEAEAEALAKLAFVLNNNSERSNPTDHLPTSSSTTHLGISALPDSSIDPNLNHYGAAPPESQPIHGSGQTEVDLHRILDVRSEGTRGKGKERTGGVDIASYTEADEEEEEEGADDDDYEDDIAPENQRQRSAQQQQHMEDGNISVAGPTPGLKGTSTSSASGNGGNGGSGAVIPTAREAATAFAGDEDRPHACPNPDCDKKFSRKSDFLRHYRIHTGERPFVCSFEGCGKSFIQRSALTVHSRVHSGDKPHACVECNRMFSDSSSLARHRRVHAGLKPFKCERCGIKAFSRKATLTRHQVICTGPGERISASKPRAPAGAPPPGAKPVRARPLKSKTPRMHPSVRIPGSTSDSPSPEPEDDEEDVDQLDHEQPQHLASFALPSLNPPPNSNSSNANNLPAPSNSNPPSNPTNGNGVPRRMSRPSPPQPQTEITAAATSDTRTEVQPVPRPFKSSPLTIDRDLEAFGDIEGVAEDQQAAVRLLVSGFIRPEEM